IFGNTLKATPRLNVGLPISQSSKADSLQFSSTLGSGFLINPNLFASKRLSVSFDLAAAYYNYMYETAIDNRVNRQMLLSQLASVGWTFSKV
ncbi:hypothetical protein NL530_27660, partial [Klebsiella pneumoniae]|nr:hypothetical protein [Klebsiella pneumoniae]